jgi:hypothetical protein
MRNLKNYDEFMDFCGDALEPIVTICADKEVAAALGIKEYAARKNREQAAKFTKQGLLDTYQAVYEAVSGIKGGMLTPSGALKMATMRLFFGEK